MVSPFLDWMGFGRIESKLDVIDSKLNEVLRLQRETMEIIMSEQEEIANLVSQVEANRDAVQSATLALNGMLDRIAKLSQDLADAIANSGDVSAEIKAAAEALAVNTAALQEAVPHVAHAITAGTKK